MLPDPKIRCPATAFAKTCREILADCDCPKYVSIRGTHPQTGDPVESVGCVDSFLPMLLIENAQQSRQAGAAIESFRNEVIKRDDEALQARKNLIEFARGGRPILNQS